MESYDVNKQKQKIKGGYTENVDKRSGGQTQVTILNKIKGKNGGVLLFVVAVLIWLIVITSLMQTRSTPEKVNCMWSDWSTSSTCTKSCGGGKQLQTRFIKTQDENGGAPCTGENKKEIDCNPDPCPRVKIDCAWSTWSPSSTCSKSCGGGKQLQTRAITKHEENGGAVCSGDNIQEIDCNSDPCPIDPCDGKTCDGGYTPYASAGTCQCRCAGVICGEGSNHCSDGVCYCGDISACPENTTTSHCRKAATHMVDPKAFKTGFLTTGMKCECSANAECTGPDANVCVNGECICGKTLSSGTGSKCKVEDGKPKCTKPNHRTPAESTDHNAVCSCEAGSCLSTVITIGSTEVNVCDTSDGECKCGISSDMHNAEKCANPHPKCLAEDGQSVPTAEDTAGTSCKCTSSSTCNANSNQPFCGNALSAAEGEPPIGVCGKCKLKFTGSGGTSTCDKAAHDICMATSALCHDDCTNDHNTCSGNKICCKNGSCKPNSSGCPA